jgi:hypothetical protein
VSFKLNGKNLSIGRLMARGTNGEARLKYIHGSAKGTSVVTPTVVARVSLPKDAPVPSSSVIWTQKEIDSMGKTAPESNELVDMPEGRLAVTGPEYLVPNIDKLLPEPSDQTASITVNGELLLKILKVACEVTTDNDKTIRLRICPEKSAMRIDTFRQPGEQEFVAVIREIEYYGQHIPGDKSKDDKTPEKPEVKPLQTSLTLKATTGRRFRG